MEVTNGDGPGLIEFCKAVDHNEKVTTFIGNQYGRYFQNPNGWFHIYRLNREESREYCEIIESMFPGFTVISFRPMRYDAGSWLRNHLDSPYNDEEGASTHSFNIMLSDPNTFKGGEFLIGNSSRQQIILNQGDAIMYDYTQWHEVKKIKEGSRWIINVRLKHD